MAEGEAGQASGTTRLSAGLNLDRISPLELVKSAMLSSLSHTHTHTVGRKGETVCEAVFVLLRSSL